MLWTDEATLTRTRVANYHRLYVWAIKNLHETCPRAAQNEFSVSVWFGILLFAAQQD